MRIGRIKIIDARYHRNGMFGNGFTAVRFREHRQKKHQPDYIAVIEGGPIDWGEFYAVLTDGSIRDTWRGDVFVDAVREALIEWIGEDELKIHREEV